ncbi:MAG: hypothetical protein ACUVQK_13480 [Thermogutta sp.]
MPVKKKKTFPLGPAAVGVAALIMILGLSWWVFFRPKPRPAAADTSSAVTPAATAAPKAPAPAAAPVVTSSAAPSAVEDRLQRLESFLPAEAEPLDIPARLAQLEAQIAQLRNEIRSSELSAIKEWKVGPQQPGDPPAVSNDFLITRPVWRVACRVAKTFAQNRDVAVRVFLRQEPDRLIAEIPANSSMEIRGGPGVYFFRATAVGAEIVVAWESP